MGNDTNNTNDPRLTERLKRAREPLDFSVGSGAVDPSHAAQDVSTTFQTGRHAYTGNATFANETLPSARNAPVAWADNDRTIDGDSKPPDDDSSPPWNTLNEANRNFYADDDTDIKWKQREQDQINDVVAWGRQIELTNHEIERAVYLCRHCGPEGNQAHGSDAIVLAALTIVANEDHGSAVPKVLRESMMSIVDDVDTSTFEDYPIPSRYTADEDMVESFETIRSDLGIDYRQIRKTRQYIRDCV